MSSRRFAAVLAVCSLTVVPGSASSRPTSVPACSTNQLSFALPPVSAPHQTWAVGFAAHNVGATGCRLTLPVELTLGHRSGAGVRVNPRVSRLTLTAAELRPRAAATVTWTFANYCGPRSPGELPIVYTVRLRDVEMRGRAGTPPCHASGVPVALRVLFACPGARGPAIDAILPRAFPLCPR